MREGFLAWIGSVFVFWVASLSMGIMVPLFWGDLLFRVQILGRNYSWGFLGWKRHLREKKCTALGDGKAMAPLFVTVELPTYLGLGQGLVLVMVVGDIYIVGIASFGVLRIASYALVLSETIGSIIKALH